MTERFKPYVAVLVFLIKDDTVLLLRRFNTGWADGQYTVPSGHVDEGESIKQAAIRETQEEVGVTVSLDSLQFSSVLYRANDENGRVYIDFFFVAKQWQGEPKITELDKCDEVTFAKLNNLPDNIVFFVKEALNNVSKPVYYLESGWSDDWI